MRWRSISRFLVLLVTISVFLVACAKKDPPFNPGTPPANTSLKVTVKHVYAIWPDVKDSLVAGATVAIFTAAEDRDQLINWDGWKETDSTGVALFEYRKHAYYYVLVDHPLFGKITDEVTTPAGTLSFLEMLFY